jgi:hypothetical protein
VTLGHYWLRIKARTALSTLVHCTIVIHRRDCVRRASVCAASRCLACDLKATKAVAGQLACCKAICAGEESTSQRRVGDLSADITTTYEPIGWYVGVARPEP